MSIDILDSVDFDEVFKPKMIAKGYPLTCLQEMRQSVKDHMKALAAKGWKFYPVHQQRGRCYFASKVITLPTWVLEREIQYREYYACHEMAHAIAGWKAKHGPDFMKALIAICPEDCIHHEISYKPRNARAAGIEEDFDIDML